MHHKTKIVEINGNNIKIDNNIVELIVWLNKNTNLNTKFCCENINNSGNIQVILDDNVTDESVFEFFNNNEYIFQLCDVQKSLITFNDKQPKMNWVIYIDSRNYNRILDILYDNENKVFLYNVGIDDYIDGECKYIKNPFNDYEEKMYLKSELLDKIKYECKDITGEIIIRLNTLYHIKIDTKWVAFGNMRSLINRISK